MALYKGNDKCLFCKGDKRPAALYLGDKQISGAVLDTVSGDGRIEYTSPYKGKFKSVEVSGRTEQKSYHGYNMLNLDDWKLDGCRLQDDGTIISNINNYYYCYLYTTKLNDYIINNRGKTLTFCIDNAVDDKRVEIIIYATRENGDRYQIRTSEKHRKSISITIANGLVNVSGLELRFNRAPEPFTDTTTVFRNPMLLEGTYTDDTLPEYEPYVGGEIVKRASDVFDKLSYINGNQYIVAKDSFENYTWVTIAMQVESFEGETIRLTYGASTGFETTAFEITATSHEMYIYKSFQIEISDWNGSVGSSFIIYNASPFDGTIKLYHGNNVKIYTFNQLGAPNPSYPIQPEIAVPKLKSLGHNLLDGDDGGTVTCPQLCQMTHNNTGETYSDTFDVQTGKIKRRVKKIVFDGVTNNVTINDFNSQSWLYYHVIGNEVIRNAGASTHFIGAPEYPDNRGQFSVRKPSTSFAIYFNGRGIVSGDNATLKNANEFNAWLKAQYDAGTPVTVWYVLAKAEEETVDVTPLEMTGGYGQIIQLDDGLLVPIKTKYYKEYDG